MITSENIFTVQEVTAHIKNLLEKNIGEINIEGEISNLSKPVSGHIYFSLKDEKALIKCAWFRSRGYGYTAPLPTNSITQDAIKNGDKVVVIGNVTVYERDGQYQIIVKNIIACGIGILHQRFEQLKEKLQKEGLFDPAHKKPLPLYPQRVGIITSKTGAALQDMLNVLSRRMPVEVYIYPAVVQGAEAPQSLIEGIEFFNRCLETKGTLDDQPDHRVDIIIIGRGGGSFEDLFCFNDEALARAIYHCKIPIISAVGHETDFTICDFTADVRAATPSVAAEMIGLSRVQMTQLLHSKRQKISSILSTHISDISGQIEYNKIRLENALPDIYSLQQTIDFARYKLHKNAENITHQTRHTISLCKNRLQLLFLKKYHTQVNALNIEHHRQRIHNLHPQHILNKGYAIITKNNIVVTSADDLRAEDNVKITLRDGESYARIMNYRGV